MADDPKLSEEDLMRDAFDSPRSWFFCLIAEIGGDTVGFAMCTWGYSSRTGRIIYLENLIVREPWRKCGVGRRLLQEIAKVGLSEGAQSLDGHVMYDSLGGKELYESLGARNVRDTEKLEPQKLSRPHLEKLAEDCNYIAESYKRKMKKGAQL